MDSQKIVKDLLNEFKESDLTEFEMETAELRLRFGRGVNAGSGMASGNSFAQNNSAAERVSGNAAAPAASFEGAASAPETAPAASAPETATESAPAAAADDNLEPVKAPLVGTFYAAPSPDADPFVQEGQKVSKGETLCILEAMKMMNELTAPYDLVVRRILGVNGEMAEYNQVLFEVEKC